MAERQFAVGAGIDGRTEPVRAADDEHQVFACAHFLLQPLGIFDRAKLAPVLIEQNNIHCWRESR